VLREGGLDGVDVGGARHEFGIHDGGGIWNMASGDGYRTGGKAPLRVLVQLS
jgi:hypothetical protein